MNYDKVSVWAARYALSLGLKRLLKHSAADVLEESSGSGILTLNAQQLTPGPHVFFINGAADARAVFLPEPSTITILGTGLLAVIGFSLRRRLTSNCWLGMLIMTMLALFVCATPSVADTFSFGGADFTCVGAGGDCNFPGGTFVYFVPAGAYIWMVGDSWSQSFATADASINRLTLDLTLGTDLAPSQVENLDVFINGKDVGSFSEIGTCCFGTVTLRQSFSFSPIAGPTYKVVLAVDSPGLPSDSGALGLETAGGVSTVTFSSAPEPSSASLIVIALGALAGLRLLRH